MFFAQSHEIGPQSGDELHKLCTDSDKLFSMALGAALPASIMWDGKLVGWVDVSVHIFVAFQVFWENFWQFLKHMVVVVDDGETIFLLYLHKQ